MKTLYCVAVLTLLSLALSIKIPENGIIGDNSFHKFLEFTRQFNKVYKDVQEAEHRFQIFKENLNRIDHLNGLGSSAKFGITQFADLTRAEFKEKHLSKTPIVRDSLWPVASEVGPEVIRDLPSSWDWREKGAVTEVKNQGECGSCWAFSTTGNIEGQWVLVGHNLTSLSEQNLVDCDNECMEYENETACDQGCNGGLQPNAYQYVIKNGGVDTEESYPYIGTNGKCSFSKRNIGAKISNWTMVSSDEDQMAAYLVAHGPLAIAADAVEWQFYLGGVFDLPCGKTLDHGILIVGYGNETTIFGHNKQYWIVKNSWGAFWGESGYIKIVRGKGKCGLNTFVSSAIIEVSQH